MLDKYEIIFGINFGINGIFNYNAMLSSLWRTSVGLQEFNNVLSISFDKIANRTLELNIKYS